MVGSGLHEHHTTARILERPAHAVGMWTLSKRGKVAPCVLLTHQLGWDLRVESGDLLMTHVCGSDREIEEASAAWKAAMIEKAGADGDASVVVASLSLRASSGFSRETACGAALSRAWLRWHHGVRRLTDARPRDVGL